jgi:hypothetical protein
MKWTRAAALAALLALASCGGSPLQLGADGPPASTFQTPPPRATDYPLARPGATAQIRGTVTP